MKAVIQRVSSASVSVDGNCVGRIGTGYLILLGVMDGDSKAQAELLNCGGSGMSVLEMSHRSKVYDDIICAAVENVREVMNVPDNYKILFLHGGASGMFREIQGCGRGSARGFIWIMIRKTGMRAIHLM